MKTIREYREATATTKAEMSRATGISTGTIHNWEKGLYAPTIVQAYKVIDFFKTKGANISINSINFCV